MSRSILCGLIAASAVVGGFLVSADTAIARNFKQLAIAVINYEGSLPPPLPEVLTDGERSQATLEDSELFFGDDYLESIYWELMIKQELEVDSFEAMWLYDELMDG